MKQYSILFIALFLFHLSHAQSNSADQDAIRKVIELETQYYFTGDYDKWASTWVHEPTSYWTYSSPDFNNEVFGWDKISEGIKAEMKNSTHSTPEEVAAAHKRHDYQYKINGNMAHVTYRTAENNLLTCTLEKQNGSWKIMASTNISTSSYNLRNAMNTLKSYAGKWKYVEGSYKTESAQPVDSNFKLISMDYDIHETQYGINFSSANVSSYAGNTYSSYANENFITDNDQKLIRYFDYQKGDDVTTTTGTASLDSNRNFVVKGMYNDKPTQVKFENIYSLTPDGLLHHEGREYDTDGKLTFKWFFTLKRDYTTGTNQ